MSLARQSMPVRHCRCQERHDGGGWQWLPNRIDAATLPGGGGNRARGGIMASDGFIPSRCGELLRAGISASSSQEVQGVRAIAAADAAGIAMLFTGIRHFRH